LARGTSPALPEPAPDAGQLAAVHAALLAWYARYGRDLPWRHTRDPYAVLVSEVMLQQTGVDRVLPVWRAWLAQYPDWQALARAPRSDVIRAWRGLGYNRRAVRLHQIASDVVERQDGRLPATLEELRALGGVGAYTAAAVACFAFEQPVAVVDTNVRRVLGRVFLGQPLVEPADAGRIQTLAKRVLPPTSAYPWNQALMDLGATVCTQARPACLVCPLLATCRAAPLMGGWQAERQRMVREARQPYGTSQRFYRGRVVDTLRQLGPGQRLTLAELGPRVKPDFSVEDGPWLDELVARLVADGLVAVAANGSSSFVSLPE